MLAVRMQRTGRSGHPQFRLIVQDSRFSPSGGRVVAFLGSYNPHTKVAQLDSEKAAKYLENGARPSDTVARLLQKEGVKLPAWVKLDEPQKRATRNPDKRRSTRPAEPKQEAAPTTEETTEAPVADQSNATVAEEPTETPTADVPAAPEEPVAPTVEEPATPEAPTEPAPEEKPDKEANSK
jgi:small subunit ribosomal protein S16